jgi:hypothetical protein
VIERGGKSGLADAGHARFRLTPGCTIQLPTAEADARGACRPPEAGTAPAGRRGVTKLPPSRRFRPLVKSSALAAWLRRRGSLIPSCSPSSGSSPMHPQLLIPGTLLRMGATTAGPIATDGESHGTSAIVTEAPPRPAPAESKPFCPAPAQRHDDCRCRMGSGALGLLGRCRVIRAVQGFAEVT